MVERPPLHLSQLQDRPFQDFQACCIPTSLERPHSLICIFDIVVITVYSLWRNETKVDYGGKGEEGERGEGGGERERE